MCIITETPASSQRRQNGSNCGAPIEIDEPSRCGTGAGTDEHRAGAALQHPVELGECEVEVGQRDRGRRDDPTLVVERPVVEQPLVVRVEHRVGGVDVGLHVLLDEPRGRREHHAPVHALLVHQLQPEVGAAELLRAADRLRQLAEALPLGVVAPVVLGPRAGRRDDDVGRVGDGLRDLAEDLQLVAAVDVDHADGVLVLLREVPRVRVDRLVHVVVGIPDLEGLSLAHVTGHGQRSRSETLFSQIEHQPTPLGAWLRRWCGRGCPV